MSGINPDFSVFQLVESVQSTATLMRHRRTMSLVSFEVENATLLDGARNRIFAGFQRMSKFLPQEQRYRELAGKGESVYVFGIPDAQLPAIANITYIPLQPDDTLSKEWFIVSNGSDYFSALATQELTDIDDADDRRMFKGVWTFEYAMVRQLYDTLNLAVGAAPIPDLRRNYVRQVTLISSSMRRLSNSLAKISRARPQIKTEVETVIEHELNPALSQLSNN